MITRRTVAALAALAAIGTLGLTAGPALAQDMKKVAVSQIVEHPALDATRKGLLDGLKAAGFEEGKNLEFTFQTAQGNPAIAAQIARQFVGEAPDVLVGIATPTAQALAAATKDIPVVFTAVTDPVGAKLVASMDAPGGNVTGLSDMSPIEQHLALIVDLVPTAKSIGLVYNPGEANSMSLVNAIKHFAPAHNLTVIEATATKSSEIKSAAQIAASKADVLYAMTDNTVATAIDALIDAANEAGKPVIGGETSFVDSGAVAALGFDYYQIGYQTADYVAAILNGGDPAKIPAKIAQGSDLVLNPKAAEMLGIKIPAMMTRDATRIVE
ncbi:MAG: ABC transporter substrate-binding protein [Alphaproteobacteria bacterium]